MIASVLRHAQPDHTQSPATERGRRVVGHVARVYDAGSVGLAVRQKSEKPEPEKAEAIAQPRAELPAVPDDAIELELEMLGGQFKAPKGTKLGRNISGWQDVSSGDDFAIVTRESFDELDSIKKDLGEVKYVVDEPDTLVYEKDGGFGFVSIIDAKGPEVLEGEADRRVECRAGSAMDWALSRKAKHLPRETVDLMVATCRTFGIAEL